MSKKKNNTVSNDTDVENKVVESLNIEDESIENNDLTESTDDVSIENNSLALETEDKCNKTNVKKERLNIGTSYKNLDYIESKDCTHTDGDYNVHDLKECPLCGNKIKCIKVTNTQYVITCSNCRLELTQKTIKEAFEKWNNRV